MILPTDGCKCPICGVPTKYWEDGSEMGLEEQYEDCSIGCQEYMYYFHFGSTSIRVGELKLGYHHTTPLEERAAIVTQIDAEINKLKQNYPL